MAGESAARLLELFPWTKQPVISSAPMRLISLAPLAVAVSRAGGIGFIGAGSDTSGLAAQLDETATSLTQEPPLTTKPGVLPVGVGFLNWGASLEDAVAAFAKHTPAAAWFFGPRTTQDLATWARALRGATQGRTTIWVQVGTVAEALDVAAACEPDVLVVQGTDAGGHGRTRGASLMTLLPEVDDALGASATREKRPLLIAAGGITDGRGVAAATILGAHGVCMGTRFLASSEAVIARGYQDAVVAARDGGIATARTSLYDQLRGTTDWPGGYNARGVLNRSWADAEGGMGIAENTRRYQAAAAAEEDEGWGAAGRLATYAGTGVGLVTRVQPAGEIVEEVRREAGERGV